MTPLTPKEERGPLRIAIHPGNVSREMLSGRLGDERRMMEGRETGRGRIHETTKQKLNVNDDIT